MRHHILPFPFCVDVLYIPVSFFLKTSLQVNLHPEAEKYMVSIRTDYAISVNEFLSFYKQNPTKPYRLRI